MKIRFLFFFFLLFPLCLQAQDEPSVEQLLDGYGELDGVESGDYEAMTDLLQDLNAHKLNLNTATRGQLEQLPFLSARQVEDLLYYVYKYGPVRSWGELSMVETLDEHTRRLLSAFAVVADSAKADRLPSFRELLRRSRHDLLVTGKIPFYERRGDRNGYLGYPYRHSFRYQFGDNRHLKAGLTGAQDAGEPFFSNRNKAGYDYYSGYIQLNDMGRLRTLVIGRYRLKFGLGLAMNSDVGFGKLMALSSLGRGGTAIRGHSSRMEASYLQGAAATVALTKAFALTAFASYRAVDATLRSDTDAIQTLLKTGYHRTQSEMDRKHNAHALLVGAHLNYRRAPLSLGLTAFHSSFDKPLLPQTAQRFRRYAPSGSRFWNMSLDYGYQAGRWSLSGETATGNSHAVATLNTLSLRLSSALSLLAVQRFYAYRYYSLYSQSFSDGGSIQNESGAYLGVNWRPRRGLSLMAYADYAYFPWPRYLSDAASHACDLYLMADHQRPHWSWMARHRMRLRQRNRSGQPTLGDLAEYRSRLRVGYRGTGWSWQTQADVAYSHFQEGSFGYMLTQQGNCALGRVSLQATVSYFHTDDYNSRVYTYERGMRYGFSFPMYYGEGIHYALWGRVSLHPRLSLTAKIMTTDYFDRHSISSSYQQIDRSSMTDLEMQFRWTF